jgi:hypothetical protein
LRITPHDDRAVLFEACRGYREQLTAARTALVEAMNKLTETARKDWPEYDPLVFPEHWIAALGEQKEGLKL